MVTFSIYLLTIITLTYCLIVLKLILSIKSTTAARSLAEMPIISIIVAVRNGRRHMRACLKSLERQTYPRERREIIIIDDSSTDGTLSFLQRAAGRVSMKFLPNLTNGTFQSSKKAALMTGIECAKGEILLFTDIDCTPPPEWAEAMISQFEKDIGLTAGFSPQTAASPLWNEILLLDAAAAALAAAGGIGMGRGVTCTGRNLAYRRSAYEAVGGFASLPDTLSGDDDFMLQRISSLPAIRASYVFDKKAVVPAAGPPNLKAFLRQKQRHLSAGRAYPFNLQLTYAAHHAANTVIWAAAFCVFLFPAALLPMVVKLAVDRWALKRFLARFSLKAGWRAFFLWEPLYAFYHLYCGIQVFGRRMRRQDWNGETVA